MEKERVTKEEKKKAKYSKLVLTKQKKLKDITAIASPSKMIVRRR